MPDRRRIGAPPRATASTTYERPASGIDVALTLVLLLTMLFQATGFYDLLGRTGLRVVLGIEYAIFAAYVAVAAARLHLRTVAAAVAFVAFVVFEAWNFQRVSGFPMNVNAALAQGSLLAIVVFSETRVPLRIIARVLLVFSIAYLLIYDVLWQHILQVAGTGSSLRLPSDGTRGDRLLCATALAFYVIVLGAFRLTRRPVQSLALIAIGGYALFVAQARFGLAISILGFLAAYSHWLAPFLRRNINAVIAAGFIVAALVFVYGMVDPGWNPYTPFVGDNSGYSRYLQYEAGQRVFNGHYLAGIGIPGSFDDLQAFAHPARPMFISDLGISGLVLSFGLVFTLIYLAVAVRVIVVPPVGEADRDVTITLLHTAQIAVLASFFNALVSNVSAVIFVSLAIAYNIALATRRPSPVTGS